MTEDTLAKYQALLESGAITQEEFDRMTAETPPEAPDDSAALQNLPKNIRIMKGCCGAVMTVSVLTLTATFFYIPPIPQLREYDIGNALLYFVGLGFWFLTGLHGCIMTFFLALYGRNRFQKAAVGCNYAIDYRLARRTLIWSAALLVVIVLHQVFRHFHPLGTP